MKKLSTLQLIPGMIVAQDVLSYDHRMILAKGTELTDKIITQLDLNKVAVVFVEDHTGTEDLYKHGVTYSTRVKNSEEFKTFKRQYESEIDSFKKVMNSVVERNTELDVEELLNHSLDIISSAKGQVSVLDMLQNMREYDDSTFAHCLNVGLICNLFATWLKWDVDEVETATACGLLHDIGKLLIPHEILTKPDKLSNKEYSVIQRHTIVGYELLRKQKIEDSICNAALMHHERCDGSGYPLNLTFSKIDKYAKLVAICDVYDAMTAARVYRGPLCPFKVIEIFEAEGLQKYDVHYIMTFLENVVNTYIQNSCRLNNGQEGTIIYINKDNLSRPIIQSGMEYVNLAERSDLHIESLI